AASTANLPVSAPATPTTVPASPMTGTGTATLFHSGSNGFVLTGGTFTSPQLGSGTYHEDGTFLGEKDKKSYWTAKATFTVPQRGTLTVRSVGGVQSIDAHGNPHSVTKETVISGTGRFAGASGNWTTTGVTTVRHVSSTIDLQTYAFTFKGTLTTKS